jgi:hypothetical protein
MTDKREGTKSTSVENACQIPPLVEPRTTSMRWLKLDLSSRYTQVTAIAVILLLFLTPLLVGLYVIYVSPPRGIVEINSGEDTFVSSNNEQQHSQDQILRVSNYSQDSESISDVSFLKFIYVPPPGGGGLVDARFSFHCSVVSAGEIELHMVNATGLWSPFETDLDNLTYSSMPPYESVPFATLLVSSNGSKSIRIFRQGGLEHEPLNGIVGLAITSRQGTQILIDSFEGAIENRPKLTIIVRAGLIVENPFAYYLNPILILPVVAGIILTHNVTNKLRHRKNAARPGLDLR